jgi:hypothetical protein
MVNYRWLKFLAGLGYRSIGRLSSDGDLAASIRLGQDERRSGVQIEA